MATVKLETRVGGEVREVEVDLGADPRWVRVDGVEDEVDLRHLDSTTLSLRLGSRMYTLSVAGDRGRYRIGRGQRELEVRVREPGASETPGGDEDGAHDGPRAVMSVMPGKVVRVLVAAGDDVSAEQGLVVIEAMKMENEIATPRPGKVTAVRVEAGQTVEAGVVLVELG